ncbi:DUF4469 domain-containing protein [Parabacteroides gordonii]|uniref:DUF4469 domain-containing protein n=1 Tax=Parabacteroides gordonii TaxID=574930 RepID=UPI0026ECA791|nr:DUF4469 domain-containing protein [Parabacteroides gordonii]
MAKKVKPGKLRGNTYPNKLTKEENDSTLNIIGGMSYGLNDLAQLLVKSGITLLREDQLVDSFRLMAEKGIEMGLMGNNINFEYFTLRFGVKGVFDTPNEPFTRPKHEVMAYMNVGSEVQAAMKETLVENMGPAQNYAQMETFINTVNGEVNKTVTSGQVLDIRGVNLSVKGDDPAVGIYLQKVGDSDDKRIKVALLLTNEPKHLMLMVPAGLINGSMYRLVHISQAGSGTATARLLKESRINFSNITLKATDGTPESGEGDDDRPVIE